MIRHRQLLDTAIIAGLFASAMTVGVLYYEAFEHSKAPPEPWVKELGAAVAFACGYGFVDPGHEPSPAVAAFLEKRIDRLSCEELPNTVPMHPPNFTQALYRYMTFSVGLTWKLVGISWTKLAVLFGLLYALSVVAAYSVFRLATNRLPAVAGALILTLSPIQLRYLPQLRDYAKVPFILALILILGLLVTRPFTRRRLLVLAVAYGAIMGLGFGFRNDLLINVLPFIVTVIAFLPVPIRSHLRSKLGALALFAVSFAVCAWPIITAYRSGSNTGHVMLLGLMTDFDTPLGVTGSVYEWGYIYDDGFAIKLISSYMQRVHNQRVSPLSRDYDRAMFEYLLLICRHWPADLLIRGYASVLKIVELPFRVRSYTTAVPPGIVNENIGRLYSEWVRVVSRLSGIGVAATALTVAAVAGSSVRVATWLLLSLLYFAGYPALQFDARHFFFLEFIPWLALATLCDAIVRALPTAKRVLAGEALATIIAVPFRRALAFGISSILVLCVPVVTLRAYQQRHVTGFLDGYVETPTETLGLRRTLLGSGQVLLRPDGLSQSTESEGRAEYLVVDIMRRNCDRLLVPVTFRYVTKSGYTDLSHQVYVPVPQTDAPFHLFFPVYYSSGGYFTGLELPDADCRCVAALRRITHIDRTPLLLNLTLPPDWHQMKLYQTLTDWERLSAPYRVRIYAWPRTFDPARLELVRLTPPRVSSLDHAAMVESGPDNEWVVRGTPPNRTSFLLKLPERSMLKGMTFVTRGTLYRGGFTLGLLKNALWAVTVNVVVPGEFLAVVEVPEDGRYVPALANYPLGFSKRNDFVVTTAGWAEPDQVSR